jgi:hypothetical protein
MGGAPDVGGSPLARHIVVFHLLQTGYRQGAAAMTWLLSFNRRSPVRVILPPARIFAGSDSRIRLFHRAGIVELVEVVVSRRYRPGCGLRRPSAITVDKHPVVRGVPAGRGAGVLIFGHLLRNGDQADGEAIVDVVNLPGEGVSPRSMVALWLLMVPARPLAAPLSASAPPISRSPPL